MKRKILVWTLCVITLGLAALSSSLFSAQMSTVETVLLADNFTSGAPDTSKWLVANLFSGYTDPSIPVSESAGSLDIGSLPQNAAGSHYNGLRSAVSYNFTGAYCYVQLPQAPSTATAADAMLTIGGDTNDYYRIYVEAGSLICQKRIAGAKTTLSTTTYNATNHQFLRIRHDAGAANVVFETAPNSGGAPGAWTALYAEAWNSSVPLTGMLFEVKAGTWQAETNSPGTAAFANFRAATVATQVSPPAISSVSPNSGPAGGSASVRISGSAFASGATVTLGGSALSGVAVVNGTTISGNSTAHAAGTVDVTVTNPNGQTATPPGGYTYSPETVLIADDFSGTSINQTNWTLNKLFSGTTDSALPVSEGGGALGIGPLDQNTSGSHYNGLTSASFYNFNGGYCYVQVVQAPLSSTAADTMLTIGSDVNDYYRIYLESGNLICQKRIGGAKSLVFTAPYNSTNQQFLGIRHDASSGNVIFETAANSGGVPGPWAQTYAETWNMSAVPTGSIQFEVKAGTWQVESNLPGTARLAHFKAAVPAVASVPGPPQVSIQASQTSGAAPLPVNFNAVASEQGGTIASYAWDFGDGTTSTQINPSHMFQSAGSYNARITVTDGLGATASASVVITATASSGGSTTLRVMQFNIDFGVGTDEVYDLSRTASWIARMNPDIVSLIEINRYDYDDQPVKLIALMQQLTGQTWYFSFVPKFTGCAEGVVVLSKYPFISTGSFFMSYSMSTAQVTINVGGKLVNFFSTHLDWTDSSLRLVQAQQVVSWTAGFANPKIIAGDFNAWPDEACIATMYSAYTDGWMSAVNSGTASAYPDNPAGLGTRTRRGRIDYAFYSGNVTVTSGQVPDQRDLTKTPTELIGTLDDLGVRPSDHNFVVFNFTIN